MSLHSTSYISKNYCIAKLLTYIANFLMPSLSSSLVSVTWARVMEERSPPLELCSLAGLGCQLATLSSKMSVRLRPGQSAERDKNTICFQFVLPILLSYLLRYTA